MTDYEITAAMITYGGNFVAQLGKAFRAADDQNRAKLKAAFSEEWTRYAELVELKQRSA
jgi:hypothetical protein